MSIIQLILKLNVNHNPRHGIKGKVVYWVLLQRNAMHVYGQVSEANTEASGRNTALSIIHEHTALSLPQC